VPDVHYRPGSVPIITVAQLLAAPPVQQTSEYDRGFAAGIRWATELANLLELDAMEATSRNPVFNGPPFVRGFVHGVRAAWDNLGGACFVRTA
jgi:hypothetical protein